MAKLTKRQEKAVAWLVASLLVLSALAGFEILHLQVSLKYETAGPGECLSRVSHLDLCRSLWLMQVVSGVSLLGALLLALVAWLASPQPARQ